MCEFSETREYSEFKNSSIICLTHITSGVAGSAMLQQYFRYIQRRISFTSYRGPRPFKYGSKPRAGLLLVVIIICFMRYILYVSRYKGSPFPSGGSFRKFSDGALGKNCVRELGRGGFGRSWMICLSFVRIVGCQVVESIEMVIFGSNFIFWD